MYSLNKFQLVEANLSVVVIKKRKNPIFNPNIQVEKNGLEFRDFAIRKSNQNRQEYLLKLFAAFAVLSNGWNRAVEFLSAHRTIPPHNQFPRLSLTVRIHQQRSFASTFPTQRYICPHNQKAFLYFKKNLPASGLRTSDSAKLKLHIKLFDFRQNFFLGIAHLFIPQL